MFTTNYYIILPDNIEKINDMCFRGNKNLTGIYGKNVKEIDYLVCASCSNLEKIEFPNLEYCNNAFMDCQRLTKMNSNENGLLIINDNFLIDISRNKDKK